MFGSIEISSWGTEKFGFSAKGLSNSVAMLPFGCDSVVKGILKKVKCCARNLSNGFNRQSYLSFVWGQRPRTMFLKRTLFVSRL